MPKDYKRIWCIFSINLKIKLQVEVTQRSDSSQETIICEQVYKYKLPNDQSHRETSGFASKSRETANKNIWSRMYGFSHYVLTGDNCFHI